MANRMKEDEKHEKIIRGLLKLPENKRCINCNSLGPQYVCTNFWTFVCTICSGIHREFTHRIKSVSMAKFTSEEVSALQRGGNERAREIYFKEWNPQCHLAPNSSNVERLRTFIKHIYVDRKYTGEKSIDGHQKGDKEITTNFRRADTFHSALRSLSFEAYEHHQIKEYSPSGRNDERNFRYSYSDRSSYDPVSQSNSRIKKSPRNFEVVDDRFRDDDKVRNGSKTRRSEDRRYSDGAPKPERISTKYRKDMDASIPPVVGTVKDFLEKNIPPLKVGESPKADGDRSNDDAVNTEMTAPSNGLKSTDTNVEESKRIDTGSLIDFDADPEPSALAAPNDPFAGEAVQQPTVGASVDDIWASLSFGTQEKAPVSHKAGMLESPPSHLSAPATVPAGNISQVSTDGFDSAVTSNHKGQSSTTQENHPLSLTAADSSQSTVPQGIPQVGGAPITQPWSSSRASNAQGTLTAELNLPLQDKPNPSQEATTTAPSQASPTEAKRVGRKELSADLFTSAYSPACAPILRWHSTPLYGMAYGMQYSTTMAMQNFSQPSKSTNPFDLTIEPMLSDLSRFPSMSPLEGSLPNMSVHPQSVQNSSFSISSPTLQRTSSLGTPSPRIAPSQLPSHHQSVMFPGAYMMQQASGNISFRHQGIEGFGSGGNPFGMNSMDQLLKSPSKT